MKFISESEAIEQYDNLLDECNPVVVVCGMSYFPSRVLAELDPIAYNCGLADWLDSEGLTTDESEATPLCDCCDEELNEKGGCDTCGDDCE